MTKNNNTDNWNQEIGSRLLELRKHYDCSQREMAEKVGIKKKETLPVPDVR